MMILRRLKSEAKDKETKRRRDNNIIVVSCNIIFVSPMSLAFMLVSTNTNFTLYYAYYKQ
jgi:hypothetical protein